MHGGMIEAKTRHVEWPDVDEETFVRLCEYAYLGDYTPPAATTMAWDERGDVPEDPEDETEPEQITKPYSMSRGMKKKKKIRSTYNSSPAWPETEAVPAEPEPEEPAPPTSDIDEEPPAKLELPYREKSIWTHHLRDQFSDPTPTTSLPNGQSQQADFRPTQNTGPHEDFAPVFLGHTQLYLLADRYGIEPLCRLVLCKLGATLAKFKLYETSVNGVLDFIRFVYDDQYRGASGTAALRRLAVRYAISVLGQVGDVEAFRDLLAEGGDFVADFWAIMWNTGRSGQ
ncbi:hypothetical protein BDW62DRAFT_203171 [Aspergillus aurantiobrunneus]